jgi:hypothetical protein
VVIYRREFPKLDLGGEVSGFLVESVVATIEVKSTLNQGAMDQAVSAAHQLKSLPRQEGGIRVTAGWVPRRPSLSCWPTQAQPL